MLYELLKEYVSKADWKVGNEDNLNKQARAVFTTLCLLENIEADTAKCDEILSELYFKYINGKFDTVYSVFENYMLDNIV